MGSRIDTAINLGPEATGRIYLDPIMAHTEKKRKMVPVGGDKVVDDKLKTNLS